MLKEFLNGQKVEWKKLGEVVNTITAPAKLQKKAYCEFGKVPIIDQGIEFIAGHTTEDTKHLPADKYIIFGDVSEHIKYVDFAFVQGADGLKILKPIEDNAKYIYYAFQNFYIKELNYKRHWSNAKDLQLPLPPLAVQAEIVEILDTLTTHTAELELRKKQYEYYRSQLLNFEK
jgi:type I restriction enzyme S subunit